MQDSFNPYQAWLGVDAQRPTYYQLLGIAASQCDRQQIQRAADQKANQVRSFRPGAHAAAWSRILDEIAAAKSVLCDPAARARYDQSLGSAQNPSHSIDSTAINNPSTWLATSWTSSTSAAPPAVSAGASASDQAIPWAAPVCSAGSVPYAVPLSNAMAPPPPPLAGGWDPMAPVPFSWADSPLANVTQPALANGPGLATGIPLPRQHASPHENTSPHQALSTSAAAASSSVRQASAGHRSTEKAQPSRRTPLIVASIGAMLLLSLALVLGIGLGDPRRTASRDVNQKQVDSSPASTSSPRNQAKSESPVSRSRAVEPRASRISSRTNRAELSPTTEVVDSVLSSLPAVPRNVKAGISEAGISEAGISEAGSGEASKPLESAVMAATTAESSDAGTSATSNPPAGTPLAGERSPSGVPEASLAPPPKLNSPGSSEPAVASMTLQERETLGKALATARLALAEENNEAAQREIATAERIARSPKHLQMVGRLKLLAQYAVEYQKALDEALSQLDSGDIIKLRGGAEVAVVEATPQGVSIRAAGRNRRFARTDFPAVLSIGIADSWLDDSKPGSLVVKGVFLLIHKMGDEQDRQRGRQLLQQAGEQGVNVDDLLQALQDDYHLQPQSSS